MNADPPVPGGRTHCHRLVLELRRRLLQQERLSRKLATERDLLAADLASRLFLVEAQLRREQRRIEEAMAQKEQLIREQAAQIGKLQEMLQARPRARSSLAKRYSLALDECAGVVSARATPVLVKGGCYKSMPELRPHEAELVRGEMTGSPSCQFLPRWGSDCDSEHSDSLDSGISSPSINSRSVHEAFPDLDHHDACAQFPFGTWNPEKHTSFEYPEPTATSISKFQTERQVSALRAEFLAPNTFARNDRSSYESHQKSPVRCVVPEYPDRSVDPGTQKPKRSSSIGSFINRTFASGKQSEVSSNSRRHSSFSGEVSKKPVVSERKAPTFISSANRTFGTNHRSVTKPRDVKFRKLFKFKRREETRSVEEEDYMTV